MTDEHNEAAKAASEAIAAMIRIDKAAADVFDRVEGMDSHETMQLVVMVMDRVIRKMELELKTLESQRAAILGVLEHAKKRQSKVAVSPGSAS